MRISRDVKNAVMRDEANALCEKRGRIGLRVCDLCTRSEVTGLANTQQQTIPEETLNYFPDLESPRSKDVASETPKKNCSGAPDLPSQLHRSTLSNPMLLGCPTANMHCHWHPIPCIRYLLPHWLKAGQMACYSWDLGDRILGLPRHNTPHNGTHHEMFSVTPKRCQCIQTDIFITRRPARALQRISNAPFRNPHARRKQKRDAFADARTHTLTHHSSPTCHYE